MNIRALFAVIRLMLSVLFRFTPIQPTKQLEQERSTSAVTRATEEPAQKSNVTPIEEGMQKSATSTEEHHFKKAA